MSLLDLADVLGDLTTETITITRYTAPAGGNAYDAQGRALTPASTTLTAMATVLPASGRDLLRLEEGFRTHDVRAVWTTTALQTASVDTGGQADRVTLAAGDFEVQHVEDWSAAGGYYKALVLRIQQ